MVSKKHIWVNRLHQEKKEVNPLKVNLNQRINFSDSEHTNVSQNLFASEGFFWLVNAATTGFALDEMQHYLEKPDDQLKKDVSQNAERLKKAIISGEVSEEDSQAAQTAALSYAKQIRDFGNKYCTVFNYKYVTILAKTIATYWLTNKLIELEFQTVLSEEDVRSMYVFLDTVISDHEEIEDIEEKIRKGQELTLDEKMYLRGSWQRGMFFWSKLYQELFLLSENVIRFRKQSVS